MPYVASIGSHLPCRGTPRARSAGADEDSITPAVAGGVGRVADRQVAIRGAGIGLASTTRHQVPHLSHVDVEEVHDFFTDIELIGYEGHGFAERFGGYKLVEMNTTTIGGAVPVNADGGLDAQAIENADEQRIGLPHNIGGPTTVPAVTILEGAAHVTR